MPSKGKPAYRAKVDGAGRILIPAELRDRHGIKPGSSVRITENAAGRIFLEPAEAVLREAQQYFQSLGPADVLWSDQLIAERRREAKREIGE